MVSLAQCLREEALSLQTLVQDVLRKPVPLVVNEDNQACIQAIKKGYSPTLRHLKRTQRVSVAQLHETFEERGSEHEGDGPVTLRHADTKQHKGDVFTKYMSPAPYKEALGRLGVTTRRKRVAGGAARVKVVDVNMQSPSTAQVRRPRRQGRRTTALTTPTITPPTSTVTTATSYHNYATDNYNTNHNSHTTPHKQPRRRKRRRKQTAAANTNNASKVPLLHQSTPTSSSTNSSSSSGPRLQAAAAATTQQQQPPQQGMESQGGAQFEGWKLV